MKLNQDERHRIHDIVEAFLESPTRVLTHEKLYGYIEKNHTVQLNGDWRAAVRRELQAFGIDCKGHRKGAPDLFRRIEDGTELKRGEWELLEDQIPERFRRARIIAQEDDASAITPTE